MSGIFIAAITVSAVALTPVAFIAWITFQAGWDTSVSLIFRARVGELLLNTAALIILVVPLSAILAILLAWLTERSDLPGARLWAWISTAPLAIPAFIHGYAWVTLFPSIHGLPAGVLLSVIAYFPFLYLPLAATLRRMDPALEDAAASLNIPPWQVFLRVVLPQLRFALCGGGLLIALHLLAEYGLYVMIRFDTFTTAIVDQFQSTFNGPAANMLAGVLLVICLALLVLEGHLRGGRRYARIGSGAPRHLNRHALGGLRLPSLVFFGAIAALALGVPFTTILRWLVIGGTEVWRAGEIGGALSQTLLLSVIGGLLTSVAAFPAAWLVIRHPGPLERFLERCHYIGGSLPSVVIALALVTITIRLTPSIYQTHATLLLAYLLIFLPRALISLKASIAQAPVELEEAAAGLGRSPFRTLISVTLRLAAPGAAASMTLTAMGIINELTATQMLSPNGTHTLATAFWEFTNDIDYAGAAPYAFIMVLMSLPFTWLLYNQSVKIAGR